MRSEWCTLGEMNKYGFSLVESMVAVVLVSAVGIIVVQLLHRNTLNLLWNRETRRAAALADMVLEKYDYLASINFKNLEQHDQVKVPANAFFVSGSNNEGYEGMTITTTADQPVSGGDGSRKLTVLVRWGAGGPNQTFRIIKYVAAGTGTPGGAPVFVYVTDTAGEGVAGFEVRAKHHFNPAYTNTHGTNEVIAFTDANGYAVLNNVSINEGHQPMEISARRPGTDVLVPKSGLGYIHGYYVPATGGAWNKKSVTVTQTGANTVRYDMRNNDFVPLGSISGRLTNVSGSADNMEIAVESFGSYENTGEIYHSQWRMNTNIDGDYEFNNLAPGEVRIIVRGREGTYPTFSGLHHHFRQGYGGFGGNGYKPWLYITTMGNPPTDITNYNVRVRPLGTLTLKTKDLAQNLLPGTTVTFLWPDVGMGTPNNGESWSQETDSDATIKLWNIFNGDNEPITFRASRNPTGCPDNGSYAYNQVIHTNADTENNIVLNLNSGVSIQGTLTDTGSPASPVNDMILTMYGLHGQTITSISQSDGSFTFCGISTQQPDVNWPDFAFRYSGNNTKRVVATYSGLVTDYDRPGERVGNVPLTVMFRGGHLHDIACAVDPNPTHMVSDTILSRTDGSFGPICAYFYITGARAASVTGSAPVYQAGNVSISTSTANVAFGDDHDDYYYSHELPFTATYGQTYTGHSIRLSLASQSISGRITEAGTGTPLQGITFDPCRAGCQYLETCPVTTDAGGHFGPVKACVFERSAASPGRVEVHIPNGIVASNTQAAYSGVQQNVSVATPATPATPLVINLELTKTGGGI
jgi:type II secretory pathway pseudopilin PulG